MLHKARRLRFTLLLLLVFNCLPVHSIFAQGDLEKRKVSDTILRHRTLYLSGPFDADKALRKLFPGKWYEIKTDPKNPDRLINWVCPTCKTKTVVDANGMDEDPVFPYSDGVATRLIDVFTYTDSSGHACKIISFNHSWFETDGIQTSRFNGGILGMAKFVCADSLWRLEIFTPAIGAYGSFSQAPPPHPLEIGDHQYAYMIHHINGGPGGPYRKDNYLIAEIGNSFRMILAAHGCGRTADSVDGAPSSWEDHYRSITGGKNLFRDIRIKSSGQYFADDTEGLPAELKAKLKGSKQGNFTITHIFSYTPKAGYQERLPAKVNVQH